MRIHLVSIGSTGDVRPFLLLGQELQRRGHQATMVAFAPFADMARQAGVGFIPLPGDVLTMMERIMQPRVQGPDFLRQLEKALGQVAPALLRALVEAFAGAEAMVCNFFGSAFYSVAEKYRIPAVQVQLFPVDRNDATPISSAPRWPLGRGWNLASYGLGYLLIHLLERRYLTAWRRENGMTVPPIHPGPDYRLLGREIPVIYAMSPLVFPRPAQWGPNIRMSGFLVDEAPPAYAPDPALAAFLSAGPPPVYIGFGSMVSGDMGAAFRVVREAVAAAGVRAILDKGWGGEGVAPPPGAYLLSGFVPHDWLFPQMAAVVHHGGAGTTAAGLRAGRPTLVIPFGGDQPFWASRVRALGCGPAPIPRGKLTVPALAAALQELTQTPAYAAAAQALGKGLRKEHGVRRAADIIEAELRAWRAQGPPSDP